MAQGRASDFAVLRILDEERADKWQVGFYSFDGDILHIEEWMQTYISSRNPPPGQSKTGKLTPRSTPPIGPDEV